ncbi:MAG: hypothetical protein ACKN9T_13530 [Candidatus Methylumidiphilus sp.]
MLGIAENSNIAAIPTRVEMLNQGFAARLVGHIRQPPSATPCCPRASAQAER